MLLATRVFSVKRRKWSCLKCQNWPGAFERLETGLVRNAGKMEEIPAVQKLVERQKVRDNERGFSMGTRDANSWKVVSVFPSFTSQTSNTGRRINRFRQ